MGLLTKGRQGGKREETAENLEHQKKKKTVGETSESGGIPEKKSNNTDNKLKKK